MWSRVYVVDRIYVIIYICVYKLLRDFKSNVFLFGERILVASSHFCENRVVTIPFFNNFLLLKSPLVTSIFHYVKKRYSHNDFEYIGLDLLHVRSLL